MREKESSRRLLLKRRVEAFERDAGVVGGEAPVDGNVAGVPVLLPSDDFRDEDLRIGNAAVETLATQCAEFGLGHVQPAAMLGRRMDFPLVGQAFGFGGRNGGLQRRRGMDVQVVQHQHNLLGIGLADIHQVLDLVRPM